MERKIVEKGVYCRMGFYIVTIFSLMMYLGGNFFIGMLGDLYESRRRYLINVMQFAILSGLFVSRKGINFTTTLLLLVFIHAIYITIIVLEYLIAFRKFSKIESEQCK